MKPSPLVISSAQNPRIKEVVRLRKRAARDERALLVVEGYRELHRALTNEWLPHSVFFCPELYLGKNEPAVVEQATGAGALPVQCTEDVFRKIAYRERPEGLLAVGPQLAFQLSDIPMGSNPLLVVAEHIEKPGNLGTILRSADAAGVDAVVVCDRCTDINNPNVVRASIGTLFTRPVIEATSVDTLAWLAQNGIRVAAATPHAEMAYTEADFSGPTAVLVGAEQYGLSSAWLEAADVQVRIPMMGQADSLNVAAATTILLYEVLRQRGTPDDSV